MTMWVPKRTIEDKKKTGDEEQLGMLWAVHASITEKRKVLADKDADAERKKFARSALLSLRPSLHELAQQADDDITQVLEAHGGAHARLLDIQKMLQQVSTALGPDYHPFIVNLALFDFRTAAGGRARKSTSVLRSGADPHYARPFMDPLPAYVRALLPALQGTRSLRPSGEAIVLQRNAPYRPPTRFTATFPLVLEGTVGDPKILGLSVGSGGGKGATTRYASLGSFGFAEPSYTTWTAQTGAETDGTRLSVGAYALDVAYLDQLLNIWKALKAKDQEFYARYGGVAARHLEELKKKFAGGAGRQLALTWLDQMVRVARAVIAAAADAHRTRNAKAPLAPFFAFLQGRVDDREVKLAMLRKGVIEGSAELFEYLWVLESTLWELTMVGASALPLGALDTVLRRVSPEWTTTVGLSETDLSESVRIGGTSFVRYYYPSGTGAADAVFETLWALDFGPVTLETNPEQLSTFTPYFEFYQQQSSLLNAKRVAQLVQGRKKKGFDRAQVWLNLSDSLHGALLDAKGPIGAAIAELAWVYIETLIGRKAPGDGQVQESRLDLRHLCLVIDYTKFAGDMPNKCLYPILEELTAALRELARKANRELDIVFLRSNLKYNTGSLDRYQSGELLLCSKNSLIGYRLTRLLGDEAAGAFDGEWSLRGQYVPLMKRTYLLADAVASARWQAYGLLWGEKPGASRQIAQEGAPTFDVDAVVLRSRLVGLIDAHLLVILSNLAKDVPKPYYQGRFSKDAKDRVKALHERLRKDRDKLANSTWRDARAVSVTVRELRAEVDQVITDVSGAVGTIPKRDPSENAKHLRAYLSRLRAAREKMVATDEEIRSFSIPTGGKKEAAPRIDTTKAWQELKAKVVEEKKRLAAVLEKASKEGSEALKLVLATSVLEQIEAASTLEAAYRAAHSLPKQANVSWVDEREMLDYVIAYVDDGLKGVDGAKLPPRPSALPLRPWKKLGEIQLTEGHKEMLEVNVDEYLDDRVIDAFTAVVELQRPLAHRRYDIPVGLLVATERWAPPRNLEGARSGNANAVELQVFNSGGNHWVLAVRFPGEDAAAAYIYDSLQGRGAARASRLTVKAEEGIAAQVRRCFHMGDDDAVEMLNGPRQPHGYECGAYVCAAIEVLTRTGQSAYDAREALRDADFNNATIRRNIARSIEANNIQGF